MSGTATMTMSKVPSLTTTHMKLCAHLSVVPSHLVQDNYLSRFKYYVHHCLHSCDEAHPPN